MKATALAILAPAAAIVLAALLQELLVIAFPAVRAVSIGMVSLDSHLEVIALLGLSFCAAYLIKRSSARRSVRIASLLFPAAFLVLMLAFQPLALSLHVAPGMNGARINLLLALFAPLLGTVLAYVMPSKQSVRAGLMPRSRR
jgi:hypothetical protein